VEKLAIKGGKPVRNKILPYGHQWIDEEDIASVIEVLKSDWITQGPTKLTNLKERLLNIAMPNMLWPFLAALLPCMLPGSNPKISSEIGIEETKESIRERWR
jgi:hypothetical protein